MAAVFQIVVVNRVVDALRLSVDVFASSSSFSSVCLVIFSSFRRNVRFRKHLLLCCYICFEV